MKFKVVNHDSAKKGTLPKHIEGDFSNLANEKWVEIRSRRFRNQWYNSNYVIRAFRLRVSRELSILVEERFIRKEGNRFEPKVYGSVVYAHNSRYAVPLRNLDGSLFEPDYPTIYRSLCERDPIADASLFVIPIGDSF